MGSCWNIIARLLAYPVSVRAQIGEEAESACRWGYHLSRLETIGITWSRGTPTCTWTPQMSIWRPHHWVRAISSS